MNALPVRKQEEPITIQSLARKHLAKAKGDARKAAAAMVSEIMKNRPTAEAIVNDAIIAASKVYVNSVIANRRSQILRVASGGDKPWAPPVNTGMTAAAASAFSSGMRHVLLDFPLTNGLRLRDATIVDLDASADRYEKNSITDAIRGRWLRSIQKNLPDGKRVGAVFGEDDLKRLYEEAEHVR